jgi:hypothetical protein
MRVARPCWARFRPAERAFGARGTKVASTSPCRKYGELAICRRKDLGKSQESAFYATGSHRTDSAALAGCATAVFCTNPGDVRTRHNIAAFPSEAIDKTAAKRSGGRWPRGRLGRILRKATDFGLAQYLLPLANLSTDVLIGRFKQLENNMERLDKYRQALDALLVTVVAESDATA